MISSLTPLIRNIQKPGAAFIVSALIALIALKPMAFEDLFEMVSNADRTSE